MRPVVKAATGGRETIDVTLDAVSAVVAAVIAYPFLFLSTLSVTGAMSLSQIASMIRMGVQQALTKKQPREGGGGSGGHGGNKMLQMAGGMLFRGLKYSIMEVVVLYGVRALSQWLFLALLHKALGLAEHILAKKRAKPDRPNG